MKCMKKSIKLVIYLVYVLLFLQFQNGLVSNYSVSQYFKNLAEESGNIKYGTWMLPGDLYENEDGWPSKFMNNMLWYHDHTHTLSKDYTCDI